jgi:hypothetical protein
MTKDWSRYALALAITAIPAVLHAQDSAPPIQAYGLGALLHPLRTEQLALPEQTLAIPQVQRDRVHFFLINGGDCLYKGNLNGVAAYFRSIGFANTSCHHFLATSQVRQQIEALHRCDPQARVVLLGFSTGANCARALANGIESEGVPIECLIYVSGDTILNTPSSRPANVKHIVNITGHGLIILGRDLFFSGDDIEGAVNLRLDVRHMSVPSNTDTIALIGTALLDAARSATPTR